MSNAVAENGKAVHVDPNTLDDAAAVVAAIAAGSITQEQATARMAQLAKPVKKTESKKTKPDGLTRDYFRQHAEAIEVMLGKVPMIAEVKEFQTGSLGFYANGKIPVRIGEVTVQVQVGVNLTIVGSKELPQE